VHCNPQIHIDIDLTERDERRRKCQGWAIHRALFVVDQYISNFSVERSLDKAENETKIEKLRAGSRQSGREGKKAGKQEENRRI
jgi:hypothetical protein